MTFSDWRQLSPEHAARTVHARATTRLSPGQQRAVFAVLPSVDELAGAFASAPHDQPLSGVPFLVKDLFDVGGWPTAGGSTFLPEVRPRPVHDGAFVRALRAAGAVCVGKTQLHECAYGVTGENPHFGDCEHPRFPGRTTGGSSSGSAAAVAAGIVPLALGSDTGGSVRIPAAFCGLFGFRLTPRDAWISDAFPLAPTCDTAGWFTASATDLRASLAALVAPAPAAAAPRGCYVDLPAVAPEIAAACRVAAARFAPPAEPEVRDEMLAGFAGARDAYNTLVAREAWEVHKSWAERYRERYDPAVWQRLNRVHALTPPQHLAADAELAANRALWEKFFHVFDFLVLPGSPLPALTKAECNLENRTRILDVTAPASLGGLPVLTIPVSLPSGLTTALQIIVKEPTSAVLHWALDRCVVPQASL